MDAETKTCTKCSLVLPLSKFWVSDKKRGYLRGSCKDCDRATARAYYADHPEHRERVKRNTIRWAKENPESIKRYRRRRDLKGHYGLTEDGYQRMVETQQGKCALCGSQEVGRTGVNGKWRAGNWNVDHCHETGRVRGLLCHKCNVRVGAYEGLMKEVGPDAIAAYLKQPTSEG